jgi:hypothetical protein
MIDLIPGIVFSDTEKQVYGSIIGSLAGALLGALFGALGVFLVGLWTRKKEIELQKIRENKKVIRDDGLACRLANTYLMNLIIKNAANRQYSKDVGQGILDEESNNTVFQINLPYTYSEAPELVNTFVNEEILALWNSLKQEIDLQNNNIASFNSYYILLRDTVHSQVFTNNQKNLNRDAIESDHRMIIDSMKNQSKADLAFRDRCIRFVATMQCYNRYYIKFDLRDSASLSEHRSAVEKMSAYVPRPKVLERSIAEVEKIYNDAGLFKSQAYSSIDKSPV